MLDNRPAWDVKALREWNACNSLVMQTLKHDGCVAMGEIFSPEEGSDH